MTNKRILTLITLLLFLFLLVGCDWLTPNQPPEIKSAPVETATAGVDYTYNVVATDPDGDALDYFLTTEPEGMLIGIDSGKITWKADDITTAGVGDYNVVVVVSDEGGLSDSQDFTITVGDFVVELIGIEVDPEEMTLSLPGGLTIGDFVVTANYNDGTDEEVTDGCVYGVDDTSVATIEAGKVTALKVGTATISISYTEGDITKETTLTVTVEGTITIHWLESYVRYNTDDSVHSSSPDVIVPPPSPDWGPAELILTDGGYQFADAKDFYNICALPDTEGSIAIDETGQLSGYATYFYNLATEDNFEGQVKIIIGEEVENTIVPDDDITTGHDGIMVGTYTQKSYKFVYNEEDKTILDEKYLGAIPCEGNENKWFVSYTIYTVHGELPPG